VEPGPADLFLTAWPPRSTDRYRGGQRLHLHPDRRGQGAGLGRGLRAGRAAPRITRWSGQNPRPGRAPKWGGP